MYARADLVCSVGVAVIRAARSFVRLLARAQGFFFLKRRRTHIRSQQSVYIFLRKGTWVSWFCMYNARRGAAVHYLCFCNAAVKRSTLLASYKLACIDQLARVVYV